MSEKIIKLTGGEFPGVSLFLEAGINASERQTYSTCGQTTRQTATWSLCYVGDEKTKR